MILPTSYTYKLNADLTDVPQIKLTHDSTISSTRIADLQNPVI